MSTTTTPAQAEPGILVTLSWEQLHALSLLLNENAERTKPLIDPSGPLREAQQEIDRRMTEDLNRVPLERASADQEAA